MTTPRVKPAGWGVGEKLTSAQADQLDINITNSLDKTSAGDTLSGVVTLSGVGRIVPTRTDGADADTTYLVGTSNVLIRVTSAVTANRAYTLSATGAVTNDVVTIYCESSFTKSLTVKDQAAATLLTLGSNTTNSGTWATFIYIGGWRVLQSTPASTKGSHKLVDIASFGSTTGGVFIFTGNYVAAENLGVLAKTGTVVGDLYEIDLSIPYSHGANSEGSLRIGWSEDSTDFLNGAWLEAGTTARRVGYTATHPDDTSYVYSASAVVTVATVSTTVKFALQGKNNGANPYVATGQKYGGTIKVWRPTP